jgi:hypothetical protein
MIERLDRLGLGWLALRGIHGFHEYVAFGVALPLSELMGDVAQGIRPSRAACSDEDRTSKVGSANKPRRDQQCAIGCDPRMDAWWDVRQQLQAAFGV